MKFKFKDLIKIWKKDKIPENILETARTEIRFMDLIPKVKSLAWTPHIVFGNLTKTFHSEEEKQEWIKKAERLK